MKMPTWQKLRSFLQNNGIPNRKLSKNVNSKSWSQYSYNKIILKKIKPIFDKIRIWPFWSALHCSKKSKFFKHGHFYAKVYLILYSQFWYSTTEVMLVRRIFTFTATRGTIMLPSCWITSNFLIDMGTPSSSPTIFTSFVHDLKRMKQNNQKYLVKLLWCCSL